MAKSKHKLGPEIAIVLGSGILDGDRPGPRTALRASAAAELALAHPKMTIIASGDGRSEKQPEARTEASHIKRIMRNMGIAKERILLESESLDTVGNGILVCAKFLHGKRPRKVYIVTSPFHEARALLIFRNVLGPDWEVVSHLCAIHSGDSEKKESNLEKTEQFFAGIAPGDLPRAAERLLKIGKPRYRTVARLQSAAKRRVRATQSKPQRR